MAAFRKYFLALAAVATIAGGTTSAFAQSTPAQALNCTVTTVVPYVRYQGLTEQVGDMIITCFGGTPTAAGVQVPVNNFSLSILSTNITSRLLSTNLPVANGGYPYSEAVLAINDPYPAAPNPTPAGVPPLIPGASQPGYSVPLNPCPASNTGTCFNLGNGNGGGSTPGFPSSYGAEGNFNLFQGYQYDAHTLRFDGIPIDAPGTNTSVIFRISNVRVDATPYASAALTGTSITASLQITGTQPVAINNISNYVVAVPTTGIVPTVFTPGTSPVCNPGGAFTVTAQEGFASSFKRQNIAFSADGVNVPAPAPQNVFGYQYFTESGYYLGPGAGNVNPEEFGLATQGTRIFIPISSIPGNVTVTAPLSVYLYGGSPTNVPSWVAAGPALLGTLPSGEAHLVHLSDTATATADGAGAYTPGIPGVDDTYFSTTDGGGKVFVYEILWSDPSAVETMAVPFTVDYIAGVPTYTAPATYITGQVGFAPRSTNNKAAVVVGPPSADTSIPRFTPALLPSQNLYNLTGCQCDLLFPYVASLDGLETGMAIANTSLDPYGTNPQSGYIQLFYYPDYASQYTGSLAASAGAPFTQTTAAKLNGGDEFLMVVGSGSANPGFNIVGAPGFQGYIIAVSGFQYCHGYAFITDTAVQKFAEGYVALQLDDPFLPRYGGTFPSAAPGVTPPAYVPGEYLGH